MAHLRETAQEIDRRDQVARDLEKYVQSTRDVDQDLIRRVVAALRDRSEAPETIRLAQSDILRLVPPESLIAQPSRLPPHKASNRFTVALKAFLVFLSPLVELLPDRWRSLSHRFWAWFVDSFRRLLPFIVAVLYVIPVGFTWVSLRGALQNYERLIDLQPDTAEQSFLALWQRGFNELNGRTLSSSAFWVIVFLGALVFFLGLQGWLDGRAEKQRQAHLNSARAALTNAQIEMARFIVESPQAYLNAAGALSKELRSSIESLLSIRESVSQMIEDLQQGTSAYTEGVAQIAEGKAEILAMARSVEATAETLADQTRNSASTLGELRESVDQNVQGLVANTGGLEMAASTSTDLRAATDGGVQKLGQVLGQLDSVAQTIGASIGAAEPMVQANTALAAEIRNLPAALGTHSAQLAREIQNAAEEARTQQQAHSAQLAREIQNAAEEASTQQQAALDNLTNAAVGAIRATSDEAMQRLTQAMQMSSDDLARAVRMLSDTVRQIQTRPETETSAVDGGATAENSGAPLEPSGSDLSNSVDTPKPRFGTSSE